MLTCLHNLEESNGQGNLCDNMMGWCSHLMTPWAESTFGLQSSPSKKPKKGTDRWAMENGLVSLTPLSLDLTDDEQLHKMIERDMFPVENQPHANL